MSTSQTSSPVRNLTIHRFISMLHEAGLSAPPMEEEPEVPARAAILTSPVSGTKRKRELNEFYVTKLFDYTIQDEDDKTEWRAWRKEQKLPSASMVSSYFGHGYRSLNLELRDIVGALEERTTDHFVQKMMDHGNNNELFAKNAYMAQTKNRWAIEWIANGSTSHIFEIEHNGKRCNILATPDMVINIPETPEQKEHKRVVEIKCPTYGILVAKKPIAEVVDDFNKRYPYGKPGHFLQVATYALLFECDQFDLFYYFTNTFTTAWIKMSYELKEEVKESIFEALHYCTVYIERAGLLPGSSAYPPVKRSTGKNTIIEHTKNCLLEKVVYFEPQEELQEDASDESEE